MRIVSHSHRAAFCKFYFVALLAVSMLLCSCAGVASDPADPHALTITTSSLTTGKVGVAYFQQMTADGGTGPYTWSITSGTLPPGLTLSSSGVLSGTPSAPGQYSFVITATDAKKAEASVRAGAQI